MFKVEMFEGDLRYYGIKQEIITAMDKLELRQSFLVPYSAYAYPSTRARVSEFNKVQREQSTGRKFRTVLERDSTRVVRTT